MTDKLKSGERLPEITLPKLGGGELRLGLPVNDHDWQDAWRPETPAKSERKETYGLEEKK